ncbi:MAG: hypothetical protein RBS20_02865 [Atribacterota bacterium]|nr:hypothetical protein [Atribacterota bacterium]
MSLRDLLKASRGNLILYYPHLYLCLLNLYLSLYFAFIFCICASGKWQSHTLLLVLIAGIWFLAHSSLFLAYSQFSFFLSLRAHFFLYHCEELFSFRHCEERSDAAISYSVARTLFLCFYIYICILTINQKLDKGEKLLSR